MIKLHNQSNRIYLIITLSLSMLTMTAKSASAIPLKPILKDLGIFTINRLIGGNSNSQYQTFSTQYSQPQYQQTPQYNNAPNYPVETYQPLPNNPSYPGQNSPPMYPTYPPTQPYQPAYPMPSPPPQSYPMNYQPYPNYPPANYAPNSAFPPSSRPIMPIIINAF